MQFTSFSFLVLFATVVAVHHVLHHRYRWIVLLFASYVFYMWWKPEFALLIAASTALDYVVGRASTGRTLRARNGLLALSLAGNLGLLVTFKYAEFLLSSTRDALALLGIAWVPPEIRLTLPVGISFYTFQTLSYSIDVCRGRLNPERHLGRFALYVAFFPQLVAGPIERASNLLPQFAQKVEFDYARAARGLRLMLWGLFKKVMIADRLAYVVDPVYDHPHAFASPAHAVATVCFAFQIYCDFSGYSDIAIGAARVLGYDLMINFRQPYFAASIPDFWRRWHISLSTWFRDYVYVPMGGNRRGRVRWRRNLLVVFAVSGLWHGANWTYVVWGLLHAGLMIGSGLVAGPRRRLAGRMSLDRVPRLVGSARVLSTFALVCVTWVFFRANTVGDAWLIVTGLGETLVSLRWAADATHFTLRQLAWPAASILALLCIQFWQQRQSIDLWFARRSLPLRWTVYLVAGCTIAFWGVFGQKPFIYFQF